MHYIFCARECVCVCVRMREKSVRAHALLGQQGNYVLISEISSLIIYTAEKPLV